MRRIILWQKQNTPSKRMIITKQEYGMVIIQRMAAKIYYYSLQEKQQRFRGKAFVYILYGCGLRRGEAIALTRFDISLERKEITVNKAIAFDVNTPFLKDTKNLKHRTVPIPESVYPIIRAYVKFLKGANLFSMPDGSHITKLSLDKMWKNILKKMQAVSRKPIIGLTPHIFRHNYCSTLCYKIPEISIGKIAGLLGDSSKIAIEVYNHEIEAKEKPIETISNAMNL